MKDKSATTNYEYYIMPEYEMDLFAYLSKSFVSRQLKLQRTIEILSDLLNTMKYLHTAKRTYNDLKPGNIMINTDGVNGRPNAVLIDFGFVDQYMGKNRSHIAENDMVQVF